MVSSKKRIKFLITALHPVSRFWKKSVGLIGIRPCVGFKDVRDETDARCLPGTTGDGSHEELDAGGLVILPSVNFLDLQ